MSKFRKKAGHPNEVLEADGFFVSYNPDTSGILCGFGAGDEISETALIKEGKYFILNGDFRKDYSALASTGWDVCFAFFKKHKSKQSSWSN